MVKGIGGGEWVEEADDSELPSKGSGESKKMGVKDWREEGKEKGGEGREGRIYLDR